MAETKMHNLQPDSCSTLLQHLRWLLDDLPRLEGLVTDIRDKAELQGCDVSAEFAAYRAQMECTHSRARAALTSILRMPLEPLTAETVRSMEQGTIRAVIEVLREAFDLPEDEE